MIMLTMSTIVAAKRCDLSIYFNFKLIQRGFGVLGFWGFGVLGIFWDFSEKCTVRDFFE